MRKECSDLSNREPLISNLDNRERALRYSITRIPYLPIPSSFQNRGTRCLESPLGISTKDKRKRFPTTLVPRYREWRVECMLRWLERKKGHLDTSNRDVRHEMNNNRERTFRYSITRIPYLFTQPSFQNRGTRCLGSPLGIHNNDKRKRFPTALVPRYREWRVEYILRWLERNECNLDAGWEKALQIWVSENP